MRRFLALRESRPIVTLEGSMLPVPKLLRSSRALFTLGLVFFFFVPIHAPAQVVTARLVSPDPLDNPAAATSRSNGGIFVRTNREEDRTSALELVNSSLDLETITNEVKLTLLTSAGNFYGELNIAGQEGTKTTTASVSSGDYGSSESSNANSIRLMPLQAVGAFRLAGIGNFGFKFIYAAASSTVHNDFRIVERTFNEWGIADNDRLTTLTETSIQKNAYTTGGLGATLNLGGGFDVGLGVDAMELRLDQNIDGVKRSSNHEDTTETNTRRDERKRISVFKQLCGLSYLTRSPSFTMRTELNYIRMPPMDSDTTLKPGEQARFMAEAIWTRFYGGFEVTNKSGYFVDPNNLIPIYFNFAHFSGDQVLSTGLFGGFKLTAGGSFGVSYYQSTTKKKERLSLADSTEYSIERKTRSFGASYIYVF